MKRILLVNHYWPPTGGPAVQRWLDLSRELVSFGHAVDVITPTDAAFPWRDESLLGRVSPAVKVHRLGQNAAISNARKFLGENKFTRFVRGNFFLPDPRKSWNPLAIDFITERLNEYDLLITAGPPQSTHLIGLALKERIKWVADFHDFWTDAVYLKDFYRTRIAHLLDLRTENQVLQSAELILAHSRTAIKSYQPRTNRPIELVWMGYYEGHYATPAPTIQQGIISHVGSLYGSYQAAMREIEALQEEGYRFRQIGNVDQTLKLPPQTILAGYLSHAEAIAATRESDELLLVNPYAHVLPGKLFEYFAAHRPIRCHAPEGAEVHELIAEFGQATPAVIQAEFSRSAIGKRLAERLDAI